MASTKAGSSSRMAKAVLEKEASLWQPCCNSSSKARTSRERFVITTTKRESTLARRPGPPVISLVRCVRRFAPLLLVTAPPAWAAFCSPDPPPSEPRHDFQFFAGYSPLSTTLIGTTTDRRFVVAGFGYSYHCWVWRDVSIAYSGELMPLAALLQ